MRRLLLAVATVASFAAAAPAQAQFAKPEDAVKYRKGVMTVMSAHFGRVGAMVNGRAPFDAKAAADNAAIAETLSRLALVGFVDGTDKGDTRAKPEIWKERDKFDAGAHKMQDEMARLAAASKTGNLDQIKAAFGPVGQACKACHDNYRKDL